MAGGQALGLLDGLGDGGLDEVLEHLHVLRVDDLGEMVMDLISCLPFMTTLTAPPPTLASTSLSASSSWALASMDWTSCICFI